MWRLYQFPLCPFSRKVRLLLSEKGIAYELERILFDRKNYALVIDPDDGLGRNSLPDGSSPVQAPEIARRAADAGLLAIFAYATPLRADRAALRDAVGEERFVVVHVATSLDECKRRDRRGSYGPEHRDPRYEPPQLADLAVSLDDGHTSRDAAEKIVARLIERGLLPNRYSL